MEKLLAEKIHAAMVEHVDEDAEIREDYSGRGMIGKTTFAVVCHDWPDFAKALACAAFDAGSEGDDTIIDMLLFLPSLRWDSMGRDLIVVY